MGGVECLTRLQDFAEVFTRPEAERRKRFAGETLAGGVLV
jgi:hypothetical protein